MALRIRLLIPLFLAMITTTLGQEFTSKPFSHAIWDQLLNKHVKADGKVDYSGFIEDSIPFNDYLKLLSASHPNNLHWSEAERLAYWINAYNAFTVKLIVDNYPIKSIKDIKWGIPMVNTVWDIKFIEIEGEKYDLNNIEHSVLRKEFDEPRIHFAINCASVSCPNLRPEAFTAGELEYQLTDQAKKFLSDKTKNIIAKDKVQVSRIFQWFRGDFTSQGSLIDFLNKYSSVKINSNADIDYLEYNWDLNN